MPDFSHPTYGPSGSPADHGPFFIIPYSQNCYAIGIQNASTIPSISMVVVQARQLTRLVSALPNSSHHSCVSKLPLRSTVSADSLPHAHRVVSRPAQNTSAICAPSHEKRVVAVSNQCRPHLPYTFHIPQSHALVLRATCNKLSVSTPGYN